MEAVMASLPGKAIGAAGDSTVYDDVQKISAADLVDALAKGVDDFKAKPSHLVILAILYPIAMVVAANIAVGYIPLPLVFPLLSGFALIGPLAAIGLYEISRRREHGLDISWEHALNVIRHPSLSILTLSVLLGVIYFAWLGAAFEIYRQIYGSAVPSSISTFVEEVLTTSAGWTLIILGCGVGFLF